MISIYRNINVRNTYTHRLSFSFNQNYIPFCLPICVVYMSRHAFMIVVAKSNKAPAFQVFYILELNIIPYRY